MKATIKIFALLVLGALLLNSCSKREDDILAKHKVEFSPVRSGMLLDYVTATVDGEAINSGDEVEEGKDVVFTATVLFKNRVLDKWEVTGAEAPAGAPKTITIKVKGPLSVRAVFKKKSSIL